MELAHLEKVRHIEYPMEYQYENMPIRLTVCHCSFVTDSISSVTPCVVDW